MFTVKVTDEQIAYATDQVHRFNFGRRGIGDGNQQEQLTGIIGQTVIADLFRQTRPDGSAGFDHGVDYNICAQKIDVKTMGRTTDMRDYYVHNFIAFQIGYNVDYYIFTSLNTVKNELTICGFISKQGLKEKATFFPAGSIRTRSDRTTFRTKAPMYEIKQTDLNQVNELYELLIGINNDIG